MAVKQMHAVIDRIPTDNLIEEAKGVAAVAWIAGYRTAYDDITEMLADDPDLSAGALRDLFREKMLERMKA
jgi:hypothetical protein